MKSLTDIATGIVLLGLCAVGAWSVSQIPEATTEGVSPSTFPTMVLVLLAALSTGLLIKGFVSASRNKWPEPAILKKTFLFIALFLAYLASIALLGDFFLTIENPLFNSGMGFSISTFVFLLLALPLLGRRRPLEVILVASITTACLIGAFGLFFKVVLP